jgi:hypothetical protein
LVIKPKPSYPKKSNAAPVNTLFIDIKCEKDNRDILIKKNPTIANVTNIPTFIATIKVSDFPTALAPRRLINVNIKIIEMAKIVAVADGGYEDRKVAA